MSFVLHHLVIAPIRNINSRGQKCWVLSRNISKTSNPSLSHPKQSWILSTMGWNDCFFGHNIGWTIAGGLGGWQDEPLLGEWRDDRMNHYWGEWGTTGWTIVGGVFGDDRMNHCWGSEGNTGKLSLGVERYLTGFSTQSQVPLSPIVVSQVVVFVSSRYAPGPSCSNAG